MRYRYHSLESNERGFFLWMKIPGSTGGGEVLYRRWKIFGV